MTRNLIFLQLEQWNKVQGGSWYSCSLCASDESMEKGLLYYWNETALISRCYYFGNTLWHLQICKQLMNDWKLGRMKLVEKNESKLQVFLKTLCPYLFRNFCDSKSWPRRKLESCWDISGQDFLKSALRWQRSQATENSLGLILPNFWPRVWADFKALLYC